jgi:dihydropteroate synthase
VTPVIRIVDASLGSAAQVQLVVSGLDDPDRLRTTWASSGAAVERVADRLHATSTVVALVRAAGRSLDRVRAEHLRRQAEEAVRAWLDPSPTLLMSSVEVSFGPRPQLMGIVNVTPDSFSDGGLLYPRDHPRRAIEHACDLMAWGTTIIDVGGESSRPGAQPVAVDEELARVTPVISALIERDAIVSIDTVKAEVAAAAL